jgi:uncharacterized 2Fe-2S/4Fe-4S cluster protein (DUF4445 family)
VLKIEILHASGVVDSLSAEPGQTLLHLLFEAGIGRGRFVCAGSGLCGKCRVRFITNAPDPTPEEAALFGADDLADGWRLSCRYAVRQDCRIEVPAQEISARAQERGEALAVDIGTTRIKWAVLENGLRGPEHALPNPQMGVGSEVMSRLRYALSSDVGRGHLRGCIMELLEDLVARTGAPSLAVVGNSTMVALLLDVPLDGLAYAPYKVPWRGGQTVRLGGQLPPAYIPPLLGPFIGADISAGLASVASRMPAYPYVLADLGTNGEFVLALDADSYIACSVPMGPAIEGVGLCCGSVAGDGVLTRATLGPRGVQWAGGPLSGVSGTGYLSVLALLRRIGVVDESGHFRDAAMPLARNVAERVRVHPLGRVFELEDHVFIAERDIEEFLKAKAGVNVALRALLGRAGLGEGDVARVYLAGALGEHADLGDLITLGFLPEIWRDRTEVAGNTALAGALLALESEATREWLDALPGRVVVERLVEEPEFGARFLRAMRFSWT